MRMIQLTAVMGLVFAGWAGGASADPGKDESGKGRGRGGYERSYEPRSSYGRGVPGLGYERREYGFRDERPRRGRGDAVRIPRGHLPPPGECRTWYANRPAGHQPPPHRC